MKDFIAIILFTLFLTLFGWNFVNAQNSWVQFTVQYDFYAPQESNFMFVSNANGDTLLYHAPTTTYETLDTIINCNAGDYIITLNDSYGDGWLSNQPASFKMHNLCQGMILNFDPLTQQFFTLDTLVNILPCGPPVAGCMDSNANNYNPNATTDDGSCIYPSCGSFLQSNAYELCWGTQTAIVFEWESANNPNCDVVALHYGDEWGYSMTWGGYWPASNGWNNFAAAAGPGQMPPNWSLEHYMVLEYADGSLSDSILYTPSPCIPGCTDSTQPTYNPWATIDDGSCAGTTCDTATQYQITMQITFDNWPNETSWIMNSNGIIGEAIVGTYNFNDIGQTYTYDFCVAQSGFELILNDTYGDGMAGSTSGGSIDGYVVIFDCNGDTIWELTNPAFGNVTYSGVQQGSACYIAPPIMGCMDDDYVEYNPLATIDNGSCSTLHIYGCTDSTSWNYNPNATINDIVPDCNYTLWLGDAAADGWGNSYIGVYQNGISLGTFSIMASGQYEQTFPLILDAGIPVEIYYFEIGGPQTPPEVVQFQTWHNSFKLINADSVVLMHEGSNPFANNGQGALQSFDAPFWTTYTGIPYCGDYCIPKVFGCMDSTALNYNPNANTADTCIAIVYGCTNNLAVNFNPVANVDDGSCIPFVFGCMDSIAWNYNFLANIDDGSCIYFGCTDTLALNYDSVANTDNGTCVYPTLGCTDATMFNYNPAANVDDGSCIPYIYGCTDITAFNYDSTANTDNGSCIAVIFGCIDSTMYNYDPLANTDNGSCVPFIYGCTDAIALNYNPAANTLDNSCCYIGGCTDSTALNYNANACFDDGSCVQIVVGCTDINAYNYNPNANVSDSLACLYDAGCITGPGNPYWLNDECYAWVISIDTYCCNVGWDNYCQSQYNYCAFGTPLDIEDLRDGQLYIYPNPTTDIVNLIGLYKINVVVFDMKGDKILDLIDINQIDFSKFENGIYNLSINYNNILINYRIIKI
jgi:hypothetical protein